MLYRTNEGKLIELKKNDFVNDKIFYKKILDINSPIKLQKNINDIFVKSNKN